MKREHRLPRRTRRQISLKLADDAENFASSNKAKKNQLNTEENSKVPINNCRDNGEKGKTSYEMKEFEERNTVDSKESFHTKNGSLNHLKAVEKRHEESEINFDDCNEISTVHAERQPNNPAECYDVQKRNLEGPLDNLALSVDVPKRPTTFVNFIDESKDANMPVVLDVFTLSQVPTSHTTQKTTNITRKNNFPVTPPCSPPLLKHEQFTGTENTSLYNETKTQFPSTIKSNVINIHNPVLPTTRYKFAKEGNYMVVDQTTRCYNFSNTKKTQLLETKINDDVIHINRKLIPNGSLVPQEKSPLFPRSAGSQEWQATKPDDYMKIEVSPETVLTEKSSFNVDQSVGKSKNTVNYSQVFLSPRDLKVLQLKRKLQEQEAALKKLLKNH